MGISYEQSVLIDKLIQDYITDATPDPHSLRRLAAEKKVLPLLLDFGGMCAINSDGDILTFIWDDTEHPQLESDPRIRNISLFQGSKKHPELKDLIVKPDDARVCSTCGGSGSEPYAAELNIDNIVCYCGGLGWVP